MDIVKMVDKIKAVFTPQTATQKPTNKVKHRQSWAKRCLKLPVVVEKV